MRRCHECGCERFCGTSKKIAIGPRGEFYAFPLPAIVCDDCGRMRVADEFVSERDKKATWRRVPGS